MRVHRRRPCRATLLAIGFTTLLGSPAWAQKTDVVRLVNGDTLTCEIKLLNQGRLEVSTDHLGTVDIEWDKVVSVVATRVFRVETSDGLRLLGQLATTRQGYLDIIEQGGTVPVDHLAVVYIAPIGRRFWNQVDGSLDLGLSYTQSSGVGQLTFSASAVYRRPELQLAASASSYLTRQEEAEDTSRHAVDLIGARSFRARSLWLVQGGFMRNRELGYELRSTGSAGIGHFMVRSNRAVLVVAGGLSASSELPVDGDATESLDALLVVRQSYFTYDSPKTDISTILNVYPGLSQWGRVRLEFDGKVKREIVKDFTVGVSIYDSYDTRPPSADARKNDIGFSVTVGWTF